MRPTRPTWVEPSKSSASRHPASGQRKPSGWPRLLGVKSPLPQARCAVADTHGAAGAQVAPGLVALPPPHGTAAFAGVLVGRLQVEHPLGRRVAPHVGDPLGQVLCLVPGLTALEVQPLGALVRAVGGVRPVVDAGRLTVGIPGLHLLTTGSHLRLLARPVAAHEVHRGPGAVPGHQVAAVPRVVDGGDHGAGHVETLPPEALEDRLQDGHEVVGHQDVDQHVEPAEVVGVQLAQPAGRQVLEGHVEALVEGAVARADGVHVGLHRHQQDGVEPLGLPVAGVHLDLLRRRPPGQGPGGVGHHQGRRAVGVLQLPPRGRHPPEAVLERTHPRRAVAIAVAVHAGDRARATVQPGVVDVRSRHPVPVARVRWREAQAPGGPAVPEGRPTQHLAATGEVGPDLHRGIGGLVGRPGDELDLHLAPGEGEGRRRRHHRVGSA